MMKTIVVLVFMIMGIVGCRTAITDAEAKDKATIALTQYAARKHLDVSRFVLDEQSSEAGFPWIFDYRMPGKPMHLVRIYIDARGRIETNFMEE